MRKTKTKISETMKTSKILLAMLVAAFSFTACGGDDDDNGGGNSPVIEKEKSYRNPVINRSVPDPTVLRDDDGTYYLYGTEDIGYTPVFKSTDLVNWNLVGKVFETRPSFVTNGGVWAPDIQKIGDKYLLYYSMSVWGGEWDCGIGVASSDKPTGPFIDHGKMFISREIGVQNSIDPVIFSEDGKNYMFWGSFHGIYGIELTADGLKLAPGAEKFKIAGGYSEGTNIYKRGDYYYLVGSGGSCCEGANSTYHVVVARSKDLHGPYVNRNGEKALDNKFELMLSGSKNVAGPGHNANFVLDDAGNTWMLYHGYDRFNPNAGRKIYLDKVEWDSDGWPFVAGGSPSVTAEKPVINKK